ncbi:sodium/potassium/calcium exchanger 3 isoform X1 [Corythoichthys intestinalis]|uniref:sodium/potassium/calcium exchanger 3 isoform X1 n=1 Tax=Corythoichthys intestinalis TaxID=161448 RepID=UPI0025A562F4|nr:sodium/potassium/calcium exchanger 3 isoform X1 [Corythoichthys intestinalis]XP_057677115.1 sodium/potassium/calcium exchanger 3 isoform X1 [Corythoichthys intestinalis]
MRTARHRRPFQRFCCCGVGLLAVLWLAQVVRSPAEAPGCEPGASRRTRGLMQMTDNQTVEEHRAAIHEFPEDIFTKEQRKNGAVLLHVLCAIYMFYALAIVCDDYFVPSLEKISENLQLSEDVAGATFMAAGSSAPELFTSLIGVFITKGDVGVGTIVGSAVFNILVIIGLSGIFAGQTVKLTWWSLFRDSSYYILAVLALIGVIYDAVVLWWESLLLMTMYAVYIVIMKFNTRLLTFVTRRFRHAGPCCVVSDDGREDKIADDAPAGRTALALLNKAQVHHEESTPVIMVDELLILSPHKLSFSEAGLRIMITPHFSPRTRLSMAGRVLISERQRLIRSSANSRGSGASPGSAHSLKRTGSCALENGDGLGHGDSGDKPEADEDDDGGFNPLRVPAGCSARVKWLVTWPLGLLLYCTVPNCVVPRWHRWFMVTFVASTLWIAVFSYLMVWMVTIVSFTLDIPDYIMGITFLAAGTSVPDCMASLIVARQGMGDMAVSNSIGSNIFDILLGLGFPWALRTLVVDHGSSVSINNKGLVYSVVLLLASVFLTVTSVHLNRWRLDRRLGLGLLFLYAIFLLCSILFGHM